jgi:hypothetical protein
MCNAPQTCMPINFETCREPSPMLVTIVTNSVNHVLAYAVDCICSTMFDSQINHIILESILGHRL